jgi:hypothetical protein
VVPQLLEKVMTKTAAILILVSIVPASASAQSDGGPNSPRVGDGLFFDEIDVSGQGETWRGMKLRGVDANGYSNPVLSVMDGQVLGVADGEGAKPNPVTAGTRLVFFHEPSKAEYTVEIVSVGHIPYSVGPGSLPAYELKWKKRKLATYPEKLPRLGCDGLDESTLEAEPDPVCLGDKAGLFPRELPGGDGPTAQLERAHWRARYHAIVFDRDRYDSTKRIVLKPRPKTSTWLNFACMGTSMAKMHLHRHTERGAHDGSYAGAKVYPTTLSQRTALLKMFTADYYGKGHPFTSEGTLITYSDIRNWFTAHPIFKNPTFPEPEEIKLFEAVWTNKGAFCLGKPRRHGLDEIEAWGIRHKLPKIPECADIDKPRWKRIWPKAYVATGCGAPCKAPPAISAQARP